MSVGPYCDLNQDVDSKDYKHGAVVSLVMDENERECNYNILTFFNCFVMFEKLIFEILICYDCFTVDRCPMYFDDGADPWKVEENHIRVFDFSKDQYNTASTKILESNVFIFSVLVPFVYYGL